MTIFTDALTLRFLDDDFVEDLLTVQLDLETFFTLAYDLGEDELKELELGGILGREFQRPVFETLRSHGSEQHSVPAPERVTVEREMPRHGRLLWVDVFLELQLLARVHKRTTPIATVTTTDLLAELGQPTSLAALRAALTTRYGATVVEAAFAKLRITSFEEFRQRGNLFVEMTGAPVPPFDPADPANLRRFPLCLAVQLASELQLGEVLRQAKLCRSVLEQEGRHRETVNGAEVRQPHVFLVIFPEDAATGELKTRTRELFAAEDMIAHFLTP